MPTQVTDISVLQEYLSGVLSRADHHASNVREIALAITGAIVWRKDIKPIEVMQRDGEMKNVLWVSISGQRYAFTYDHSSESILMLRSTTQGQVLHSFTNTTSLADLYEVFRKL